MLMSLMFRVPALLPLGMVLLNLTSLMTGILYEGRVKEGAARFLVLYASTIPAAMRGDLSPFLTVVAQPG